MYADRTDKALITFGMIAISTLIILTAIKDITNPAAAPSGRRWPVNTGMHLPLVNILDENGYYATLACTVTSFNNEAHSYNLSCGDAPAVIQVGNK
jgi:hypothetical protein